MGQRLIRSESDIGEGAAWLATREPRFAHALARIGPLPLRLEPDGFAALLQKIVGQQVSVAAARAIWGRVAEAGLTHPAAINAADDASLRACGLSRPKVRYARALAQARVDFVALRDLPDEDVIATLTRITGIGAWTAQVYAMFNLGRPDVFAPADLALQEATRQLFDLAERPSSKALAHRAEDWSPWRSVAARLLFTYYKHAKKREGMV